ncbi:MAG: hypothetical protein KKH77_07030 [Candidatus Omnitrophica bacterium]|nr:hypothetical protein [Candidatus Omnitrophota bacterium]MBU1808132.1 hypothetical protein [Candidatus Omnitrophota bacterium]
MPKKKKTPGTISQDEGLNKLKAIKEALPPPPPVSQDQPGISQEEIKVIPIGQEPKPVSGIFKSIYPLFIDMICHITNKEKFNDTRKAELLDSVSQDLDELERRYIPETVRNMPGIKALSITGIAVAFQPKAKKEPAKKPEDSQPEPENKPEPPAPAAPPTIPEPAPQPGLPA